MSEHQPEQSGDIAKIWQSIAEAEAAERNIDDATARRVASQLHSGQTSAMYSLASTGAVNYGRLRMEIISEYETADTDTRRLYDHIGTYALEHAGRMAVEGWYLLTED